MIYDEIGPGLHIRPRAKRAKRAKVERKASPPKAKAQYAPQGAGHHKAKLSDEDCRLMRSLRQAGLSYAKIAEKFEVHLSTARNIVNYATRRSA